MDPRITPEIAQQGDALIRLLLKGIQRVVRMLLDDSYKIVLVLAAESDDGIDGVDMLIVSDVDKRADMEKYLNGAIQRITNPTDKTIDSSDPEGAKH